MFSVPVTLAIAMILWGNEQHWYPFAKTIRQIYEQDPKPNRLQSLVIVLELAENRKPKIKEIIDVLKTELDDLLSNGYVQLVISKFDAHPSNFINIKQEKFDFHSDVSSLMNYRLAFLFKYCSEIAQHVILLDSEASITESAMKKIYKEIDSMEWNVLEVNLGSYNTMHRLYQGRYLPRVYGTFYSLAQVSIPASIIATIDHLSTHAMKKQYKGETLIKSQTPPVYKNPPAKLTYKISAVRGTQLDDFYLYKGPSWFITPVKGDYVTATLDKPAKLKLIYAETGLDSFKRDVFRHAVLELSYGKDRSTNECTQYNVISSFEGKSVILISKDDAEMSVHLSKPVHCVKIRVTENCNSWASLKALKIEKDE